MEGAWIFPLIPALVRIIFSVLNTSWKHSAHPTQRDTWLTLKRICFYLLIFLFRGFVLLLLFNVVEEKLIQFMDWDRTSDECWYQNLLRERKKKIDCYGQSFDFSDHIVLFYGQILSIALFEIFFFFLVPLWSKQISRLQRTNLNLFPETTLEKFTSVTFLSISLYMYFITSYAAFRTAAYFHTWSEIIIGFIISFFIQYPLIQIMCDESWTNLRKSIGLHEFRESIN